MLATLDAQLLRLAEVATPSLQGRQALEQTLERIREACTMCDALSITAFGSSVTGLSLPTSDLDVHMQLSMMRVMSDAEHDVLKRIGSLLSDAGVAQDVELIRARVPLLRFVDTQSQTLVDLNVHPDSASSQSWMDAMLQRFASLRPVVLALKVLLQQRGLHTTHQGGIGSYLLTVMASHVAVARGETAISPGELLLAFLEHYGSARSLAQPIHVQDPANPLIDVGQKAYRYRATAEILLHSLCSLRQDPCLSQLVSGWPANGLLGSNEELHALLTNPEHNTRCPADEAEQAAIDEDRRARIESGKAHLLCADREALEKAKRERERSERQQAHEQKQREEIVGSVLARLVKRVVQQAEMEQARAKTAMKTPSKAKRKQTDEPIPNGVPADNRRAKAQKLGSDGEQAARNADVKPAKGIKGLVDDLVCTLQFFHSTTKSVFVGNLPFTIEANAVEKHMTLVAPCTVQLKTTGHGASKRPTGFAIVNFDSIELATKAVEDLHDSELGGRKISVRIDKGSHDVQRYLPYMP